MYKLLIFSYHSMKQECETFETKEAMFKRIAFFLKEKGYDYSYEFRFIKDGDRLYNLLSEKNLKEIIKEYSI